MVETFDIETNSKVIKISKAQNIKENIVFNGEDNKYPQIFENLIDNSETASLCTKTKAKFLATKFVDETVGKSIIGKTWINRNYTVNQLIRDIAYSLAKYNGCYCQITKNLAGEVVNISVVDFPKVRFTEFDDSNRANAVYIGDFNDEIIGKKAKKHFIKLPLFNSDINIYKMLAEEYGTTASIYPIFLDSTYYYPRNSFESVAYDMATEAEIQSNRYNEITQGSPSKLIIRTDFSKNETDRKKQIDQIRNFAGSKGERVLLIRSQFDDNGAPISNGYQMDVIPDTRDLDQFTVAESAICGNIRKALQLPSILVAPNDGATVDASAAQLSAAVDYYNDLVRDERLIISESLAEIFEHTVISFPSKNFELQDFQMTVRNNE